MIDEFICDASEEINDIKFVLLLSPDLKSMCSQLHCLQFLCKSQMFVDKVKGQSPRFFIFFYS